MRNGTGLERYEVDVRGCWLWTGPLFGNGYPCISNDRYGTRLAHRASYVHHIGPIPDGLELDHLCREPRCINPQHLEPVTRQVNMERAARDRRYERTFPQMPSREQVYALNRRQPTGIRRPRALRLTGTYPRGMKDREIVGRL